MPPGGPVLHRSHERGRQPTDRCRKDPAHVHGQRSRSRELAALDPRSVWCVPVCLDGHGLSSRPAVVPICPKKRKKKQNRIRALSPSARVVSHARIQALSPSARVIVAAAADILTALSSCPRPRCTSLPPPSLPASSFVKPKMSNSNNVSSTRALVMLVALIMVSIAVAQMTPPKPCARSSDCGSSTQYCRLPGIHPSLRATPNASRCPSVDDDGS